MIQRQKIMNWGEGGENNTKQIRTEADRACHCMPDSY